MASRHMRDLLNKREKRSRERKNLSFVIVIMFFVIFCVIVLTEILVMEDRNKSKPLAFFTSHNRRSVLDYDERQVVYEDAELYKDILDSSRIHSSHSKSSSSNSQSVLPDRGNLTAKDAVWQTVPGTRFKFYVYSAHYDDRKQRVIRVVGASKTRATEKVYCRFWFSDNSSSVVTAKIRVIRENWNMKYSAIFLLCPVEFNVTLPASVSIVNKLKLPIRNILVVRNNLLERRKEPLDKHNEEGDYYNGEKEVVRDTMVVCVKPLHFTYDKVLQMLEFLELNKLLGAAHINFYVNSVSDSIQCILNEYNNQTVSQHEPSESANDPKGSSKGPYVSTYEWHLNMISQKEIRTEGLFAALNDCLYRNMYVHDYIMFIDLDEFIMPQQNTTLVELIHWLSKHLSTHSIGSYSFQNAFFYLQWPDDESISSAVGLDSHLVSIAKTKRKVKLHPHKQRSKYIIRPEYVVEVGNHFVWEFIPGHGSLNVPQNMGILHHYRICEFGGNDCVKQKYVEDRTAHRYKTQLVTNVETVYYRLKDKCGFNVL